MKYVFRYLNGSWHVAIDYIAKPTVRGASMQDLGVHDSGVLG
jgi:hypothetical protein